jgi:hypothetical protein
MKHISLPFPLVSVLCVGFAYGLLGWRMSAISAYWLFDVWLIAIVIIFVLTWWGNLLGGLIQIGARSLLVIFFLSIGLTLAISYAESFALCLSLFLTIFWSQLEMQIRGVSRTVSLTALSAVVGISLSAGWLLGKSTVVLELLQRPAHWIQGS